MSYSRYRDDEPRTAILPPTRDPDVMRNDERLARLNAELFNLTLPGVQAKLRAEQEQARRELEIAVSLGENI